MIDIHCHILPGLDDGARSIEESVLMARVAVKEGITGIVATPHHRTSHFDNERQAVLDAVELLQQRLVEEEIPLEIYPGQEIRIHSDMSQLFNTEELVTINNNNRYFLLELPFEQIPTYTEQLLFNVQTQGFRPILVHPERHHIFQEHPNRLFELIQHGAVTQLTAGSLTGRFGKKVKKLSEDLLRHNFIQLIASDAHQPKKRGFELQEAYRIAGKIIGRQAVYQLMENAERVLKGQSLVIEEPIRIKHKRFLGLF